jgi:hypothetical protein
MLIDDFLPKYSFDEIHSIQIRAPIESVYQAFKGLTLAEISPLVQAMFVLRSLPGWLMGKSGLDFAGNQPLLEQMQTKGFLILNEIPPYEFVIGVVGQFWKLSGGEMLKLSTPDEFLSFNDPDLCKCAANFILIEEPGGTVCVSTETRVDVTGAAARRKFALYWRFISVGSGLIRILWLRAIKRRTDQRKEI